MKKRKWFLLAVILLVFIAWYNLFHKSYSNKTIAKSADIVLSIDVKRNTNTILAYFLTTPAEWNFRSILHFNKDTTFDWKSAIIIPDYIFIFHCKSQPAGAYYFILTIKNDSDFQKGLAVYDFKEASKENGQVEYYSDKLGVVLVKNNDQILISNLNSKNKELILSVADEIFNKKEYISKAALEKIVSPPNHFTIYLQQNNFLQEDAIINGNFKKGQLVVEGLLNPRKQFSFIEDSFNVCSQSLFSLAFTQPSPAVYTLLPTDIKANLSAALNFNVDSLLSTQNKKYSLDISGIKSRTDSAVSYTFDDDFNKVEKVVVNQIQEPSFNFIIYKEDSGNLFQYWKKNKNIEKDSIGDLFVSIPFVKTYAYNTNDSLSLTSYNYNRLITKEQLKCIGSLTINTNKITPNLINYLPDYGSKIITNIESVNCKVKKNNESINITLTINNKNNNKPFLLSFK
jgi:hypothetical protein